MKLSIKTASENYSLRAQTKMELAVWLRRSHKLLEIDPKKVISLQTWNSIQRKLFTWNTLQLNEDTKETKSFLDICLISCIKFVSIKIATFMFTNK